MGKIAKYILFSGRVQGVGFRFTAHRMGARYNLTGFVRNTHDGKVEVLAQGSSEGIDGFISDLRETFSISDAELKDAQPDPKYDNFNITF